MVLAADFSSEIETPLLWIVQSNSASPSVSKSVGVEVNCLLKNRDEELCVGGQNGHSTLSIIMLRNEDSHSFRVYQRMG